MTELFIDDNSIERIRKEFIKEDALAMRIFIGGGGCCQRFEIIPVRKELANDVVFIKSGLKILVEKEIAENVSSIRIKYDEHKGLLIDFTC